MAGYKSDTSNAWASVQVYPNSRIEIFANTAFNNGTASITDFDYDAGALTSRLFGLDYPLHSASMSGFSTSDCRIIGGNCALISPCGTVIANCRRSSMRTLRISR